MRIRPAAIGIYSSVIVCWAFVALSTRGSSQEKDFNAYPDHVTKYLGRLYDEDAQPLVFHQGFPGSFDRWQKEALTIVARAEQIKIAVCFILPVIRFVLQSLTIRLGNIAVGGLLLWCLRLVMGTVYPLP